MQAPANAHESHLLAEIAQRARVRELGCLLGFAVVECDGPFLRNFVDVEFTEGGNPGRYPWIPPGELWVERTTDWADMLACAVHELHESQLMAQGLPYEEAHSQASGVEVGFRAVFALRDDATFADAEAWLVDTAWAQPHDVSLTQPPPAAGGIP